MDAKNDLFFVIGLVLLLIFAWVAVGGPGRAGPQGIFLRPPAPLGSGGTYGPSFSIISGSTEERGYTSGGVYGDSEEEPDTRTQAFVEEIRRFAVQTRSPLYGAVRLSGSYFDGPRTDKVQEEYVTLEVAKNLSSPILVTGWSLKSAVTGTIATIGKGAYLPAAGGVNYEEAIFLDPGATAYVVSGRPPVGVSFRVNACTGYFNQFQSFRPDVPEQCPAPIDEISFKKSGATLSSACYDYLESMDTCRMPTETLPPLLPDDCSTFITENINYNGCVENHRNDPEFYGKEWRIYLSRSSELWDDERESIQLLDEHGALVAELTYN